MAKIGIVTDSNVCMPPELVSDYDIRVVPLSLNFGQTSYRDGVDINPTDFYEKLKKATELPTTSAPILGDFIKTFTELRDHVEGVVCVMVSSGISSTFEVGLKAAELVDDLPIRVIDCRTATMAQGFIVLEAARAAKEGANLDEVIARTESTMARSNFLFILEDMSYLARGGRMPPAAARLGSALKIIPVMRADEGKIGLASVVRTRRRAVSRMVKELARAAGDRPVHVAVMHAQVPDEAEALRQEVDKRFDCIELYVTEFTPVMGAHVGPGLLGLAYFT